MVRQGYTAILVMLAGMAASGCWSHPLMGLQMNPGSSDGGGELAALLLTTPVASAAAQAPADDGSTETSRAQSPDAVSGLELWLEADQITGMSDGQAVLLWPDGSGAVNDALQGNVSEMPVYREAGVNGLPSVEFTNGNPGTNLILSGNYLFSNNDGITVLAVARSNTEDSTVSYLMDFGKNGQGGYGMMFSANSDGSGNNAVFYTPVDFGGVFTSTAVQQATSEAAIVTARVRFDPAANKEQALFVNGTQIISNTALTLTQLTSDEICRSPARGTNNPLPLPSTAGTCSGGPAIFGPVTIGGQSKTTPQANRFFDGEIALVIWYNRALSDTEREELECYASLKYGVAVAHSCFL